MLAAVMKALSTGLLIALTLATPGRAQIGGGEWVTLTGMGVARQEMPTAVLNGKIYVIGGYDSDQISYDTVEVYNPATDVWTFAQPVPSANNHSAAAVAGGKLYAFAGLSNRAYVYDPAQDAWTQVASMAIEHGNTPAVGVIDDKIYVAGGTGGTQRELEVYNPLTNTWSGLANMEVARNHCAGGVIDGKLYVVGGRGSVEAPTALEVYDPQSNQWSSLPPMPTGRSGMAAAVVHGELYVFGGEVPMLHAEVEAYNPVSNSWRSLPDMPRPRHGIWASVIGNKVYIPGGGSQPGFAATGWNDVFIVNTTESLANISTRLSVGIDDHVLIGGFIVTGDTSKRILLRAIGPSVGLPGALADPFLELHDSSGRELAVNDNWRDAPNEQEIIDSSIPPPNDQEAAMLTTLAPGSYTAIVRGVNNSTGVALVEAYDLETGGDSELANISTRGFVQTGDDILIGGLILDGQISRQVIVRAIGPSLALPDALADPTLELHDSNGALLASNDNWRTTQETEIIATTIPPPNDLESALVQTLPPGAYTAVVRGQNASTGIALVEAFALD